MDLVKLKEYYDQIETLWSIREKADDDVTELLREIKEYNEKHQLNMTLFEDGRMSLNFAFDAQSQNHRVNTFLKTLKRYL